MQDFAKVVKSVDAVRHRRGRSDRAQLRRAEARRPSSERWSGGFTLPEITECPLARTADAHRVSEGGHLLGKLILRVR
jgi:hypothetical protein